ncbi:bromodomain associated protein [Pelomyxa schiedti]|nr:bromodomain associated protein [Pelomyxa schiedti]
MGEYARRLLEVAIAQVLKGKEIDTAQTTALDTLTDVVQLYIEEIGLRAHRLTEHARRTQSNFSDVIAALGEMDLDESSLRLYLDAADEIPFPKDVPQFPLRKEIPAVPQLHEPVEPQPPHIPEFFPRLPDKHTYVKTTIFCERTVNTNVIRQKKAKQQHQAEIALSQLVNRLNSAPVRPPALQTPPTVLQPTPILERRMPIHPTSEEEIIKATSDGEDSDIERHINQTLPPPATEEGERGKKRTKCDSILNLTHREGEQALMDYANSPPQSPGGS